MPQSRVQEYITIAMFELLEKKDYAHIIPGTVDVLIV